MHKTLKNNIIHIVIADDDEDSTRLTKRLINAHMLGDHSADEFQIHTYANGREAFIALMDLNAKQALQQTIFITDDNMPGMSGSAVLAFMHNLKNEDAHKLSSILVSGREGLNEGTSQSTHMYKPVDFAALIGQLNIYLHDIEETMHGKVSEARYKAALAEDADDAAIPSRRSGQLDESRRAVAEKRLRDKKIGDRNRIIDAEKAGYSDKDGDYIDRAKILNGIPLGSKRTVCQSAPRDPDKIHISEPGATHPPRDEDYMAYLHAREQAFWRKRINTESANEKDQKAQR